MEEANEFLRVKEKTAGKIALGVLLCVCSPICVMILSVAQEEGLLKISGNAASGMGLIVLFLMIAAAVALFIYSGMQTSEFEYLEKEILETAYGVDGMVRERMHQYKSTYTKYNIIGTCLCVLSVVPLFAALVFTEDDFVMVLMTAMLLAMIGIATTFFVNAGLCWDSMKILLQEEDYTIEKKRTQKRRGRIYKIYWLVVVAVFFILQCMIEVDAGTYWVVATIIFAIVVTVYKMILEKK